jgi:hypothetical protein
MRARRPLLVLTTALGLAVAGTAGAQPYYPPPTPPPPYPQAGGSSVRSPTVMGEAPSNLRGRFGIDVADRLMHGESDDRIRGIRRAAAMGTPEAISLLATGPIDPMTIGRTDSRALLELARALARFTSDDAARARLLAIVQAAVPGGRAVDVDAAPRVALARATAARALATSSDHAAREALLQAARAGGPGQQAALAILAAFGLSFYDEATLRAVPVASPPHARAVAQSGDLRMLDALKSQVASSDPATRAAALVALAQLGDMRILQPPPARADGTRDPDAVTAAFGEKDARLRSAAGEAFVLLDAPQRFGAVTLLVADDATAKAGIRLAERAQNADVVKALAARLAASHDLVERRACIAALGRGLTDDALKVIVAFAADRDLAGDVAHALARSPNAGALPALEKLAATNPRLAVRGYALRVLGRGGRSSLLDDKMRTLALSKDGADRSVGRSARVALGDEGLEGALGDADPRVRRTVAVAALALRASSPASIDAILLSALTKETDPTAKRTLALGLLGGDPDGKVPTLTLVDRAEAGGADAPLAAMALCARKDEAQKHKVELLLAARDPLLRLHAARGLAKSELPESTGMLAEAYRFETDVLVRRELVRALAAKADAPVRAEILGLAATLDPDGIVRDAASRALSGAPAPADAMLRDVAWLHVTTPDGSAPPPLAGAYVTSEGAVLPIAFDADGFAIVPGVSAGEGRLVLEPSIP